MVADFIDRERTQFIARHPKSQRLSAQADGWRGGVPMHWMGDWATAFPIYVERAKDAELFDVDGHRYDDFCLGDTPSMFGHARDELSRAIAKQAAQGMGFMLPTPTSNRVATLLAQRFKLLKWQVATTASDANRAAIRWARAVTKRRKILVFDGCYHGMVEDCFVTLRDGETIVKPGQIGLIHDLTPTTVAVPFNDLPALERALSSGEVAAILAEPIMTNCGMIAPDPEFWGAAQRLCSDTGTLLILDETHTLSSGPAGYAVAHGLTPDALVIGKAIAGGIPAAVWGVTDDLNRRMDVARQEAGPGSSGIGTTLSGNALSLSAIEAMLTHVITDDAYRVMLNLADHLVTALKAICAEEAMPWSVVHAGARVELVFAPNAPRNAEDMRRALAPDLLELFHLYLINRGILIAPFHNMMLISPVTARAAVDRLSETVREFARILRPHLL